MIHVEVHWILYPLGWILLVALAAGCVIRELNNLQTLIDSSATAGKHSVLWVWVFTIVVEAPRSRLYQCPKKFEAVVGNQ